eukprot:4709164-Ditylum_brightwellii.AAC.1
MAKKKEENRLAEEEDHLNQKIAELALHKPNKLLQLIGSWIQEIREERIIMDNMKLVLEKSSKESDTDKGKHCDLENTIRK